MKVPYLDLARLHASIAGSLAEAFERVVSSSAFIGGEAVDAFEAAFAGSQGHDGSVGCGSGTDALALTLEALGVGAGDEVVVPAMTFVATAEAVVRTGAMPVLADVDPETLLLTPASVVAVRTDRTKAVVPVHLYGHLVPLGAIETWIDDGLVVVEDAAQAHGASFGGAPLGAVSSAACFSFYPGKNLGGLGDGGAVVSRDGGLLARIRRLGDHGATSKYVHEEVGYCSRLDGLQAAFLLAKLPHLADWNARRSLVAHRYQERLAGLGGVRVVPWGPGSVHHVFAVRIQSGGRDEVRAGLEERGIGSGVHYPLALSQQPALAPWWRSAPVAERAASELLSLPLDPLMGEEEVDLVCAELADLVD